MALQSFGTVFCAGIRDGVQRGESFDSLGLYGLLGERGELIDAGQVVMATDRSGRRTMPTGTAGSPIDCQDCERRRGWSRGRSTCCAQHRGEATEWKEEERVRKNGGRIGERNEEITKKIKAKFLIERICKYEEYPKMVKEAGQHLKRNTMVK